LASNHYGCSIGYLVQSNAAAVNPTWNLGSAQSEAARIASFKPLVTPGSGGTGGSASTTMRFVHTDNLSGSSVVTDATGSVVENQDYYPYGGLRVDTKTSGYGGVRNKYAGTIYDALSGLNYAQARYQNSTRGQFISEDPVFLADPRQQSLTDPQSLNSYGYADDNPITKSDPTGRCVEDGCIGEAVALGAFVGGAVGLGYQYASDVTGNIQQNGLRPADFVSGLSSPQQYAVSTGKGVAVGGATAFAAIYGLGVVGVGLASGVATGLTDLAGNAVMKNQTGWSDVGDVLFNTVSGGVGEYLPGVPGRLPQIFSQSFFTGSHAQNSFAQSLASAGVQLATANAGTITTNAQLSNLKNALQALSAVLATFTTNTSGQPKK
jgi:RHS repeat-associated protein